MVQRVSYSSVKVDGQIVGEINGGINILLGVVKHDTNQDVDYLIDKIVNLRMFSDSNNKMNLSIVDVNGSALVISQFTLAANLTKGKRPSFDGAETALRAKELYNEFVNKLSHKIPVKTGIFSADMSVEIHNNGPVTFIIDSKSI